MILSLQIPANNYNQSLTLYKLKLIRIFCIFTAYGTGDKRMKGKAPRAVIYTRVSSDKQPENTSLTEQHAACTAKAEAIGAQIVGYYEDPGVSGGLYLARPGIQQALEDLESGKADTLIIAKLDRCSRDREHQSTIKKRVALRRSAPYLLRHGLFRDSRRRFAVWNFGQFRRV
jgi:hypothetical protein